MFFMLLPKELRLQIWTLAYFSQPPRLVALRTKPHDENHAEDTFCPRYSPSPAPIVVNICHEARAEAQYQARKAGHLVRLCPGRLFTVQPQFMEEFYFRFETDVLYLPLEDEGDGKVKHFDDSPEVGFLAHFRSAVDCDTTALRNIAITNVMFSGYMDCSLSDNLRHFPNISRMIMVVPQQTFEDAVEQRRFVRASRNILWVYDLDMIAEDHWPPSVHVDFATITEGKLDVIPTETWKRWSD